MRHTYPYINQLFQSDYHDTNLHLVQPPSDSRKRGKVSYVIHGEDSISPAVILLGDATEPKRQKDSGGVTSKVLDKSLKMSHDPF